MTIAQHAEMPASAFGTRLKRLQSVALSRGVDGVLLVAGEDSRRHAGTKGFAWAFARG